MTIFVSLSAMTPLFWGGGMGICSLENKMKRPPLFNNSINDTIDLFYGQLAALC